MSRLAQAPLRQPPVSAVGMGIMAFAMLLLPMGDAISKSLTIFLSPAQVAAGRAVVQALLLGVAFLLMRRGQRGSPFSFWSFVSGQCVAIVSLCLIAAFKAMPIATAIAIFFVEPLLLTLLAGFMLGEKPGPHRYAAIAIGMAGVLLILRPNFAVFGPVVFLPIAAAFGYALNMIATRRATRETSALAFQLGSSVYACLTLAVVMAISTDLSAMQATMTPEIAAGLVGAGVLAAGTFLLIAYAFSLTEASILAPFQYLEILGAILVGFFVFGDVPDKLTLLGTIVILGAGLYVFHRERRAKLPIRRTKARQDR